MPKKPSGDFDQKAYIAEYHRTHLRALTIKVQRDEYDRFQAACEAKGEPMATALRHFMAQYVEETEKVYKNHDESLCNLYSKYLKVSIDKKNIW